MNRNGKYNFAWGMGAIAALALSVPLMMVAPAVSAAGIATSPPASFKKVSSLVKLPDFVPGLGTLYVDPATLPVGPFLGYNHKGTWSTSPTWFRSRISTATRISKRWARSPRA